MIKDILSVPVLFVLPFFVLSESFAKRPTRDDFIERPAIINTVSDVIESPHTVWGKPLAGGPIK